MSIIAWLFLFWFDDGGFPGIYECFDPALAGVGGGILPVGIDPGMVLMKCAALAFVAFWKIGGYGAHYPLL
jgi:hypothetical protein